MIIKKDIEFVRGDTFKFQVGFIDLADTPTDLYFTIRERYDLAIVVEISTQNGNITPIEDGEHDFDFIVRIPPELTATLQPMRYKYDLQVNIGSDKYTVLYGNLNLLPDITQV